MPSSTRCSGASRTRTITVVSGFIRLSGAPAADRNLVGFYVDGGLVDKAPLADRGDDTVGLALAIATVSGQAQALDRDLRAFGVPGHPIRDYEAVAELTYQYELSPWWVGAARPAICRASGRRGAQPGGRPSRRPPCATR